MTIAISKKIEMIYNNGQPDVIRSIRQHLSTMTTYNIIRIVREKPQKADYVLYPHKKTDCIC